MTIRSTLAWVSALVYVVSIPTLIEQLSFAVAALPAVTFVALAGTNDLVERLPDIPTGMYVIMVMGCASLGVHHLAADGAGTLMLVATGALGVAVGLLGYFVGMVAARMIGASVLGVDLEAKQREQRKDETGDPYGDPHAARILDDP